MLLRKPVPLSRLMVLCFDRLQNTCWGLYIDEWYGVKMCFKWQLIKTVVKLAFLLKTQQITEVLVAPGPSEVLNAFISIFRILFYVNDLRKLIQQLVLSGLPIYEQHVAALANCYNCKNYRYSKFTITIFELTYGFLYLSHSFTLLFIKNEYCHCQ